MQWLEALSLGAPRKPSESLGRLWARGSGPRRFLEIGGCRKGVVWAPFGPSSSPRRGLPGASRGSIGPFRSFLGPSRGPLEPSWGQVSGRLGDLVGAWWAAPRALLGLALRA
eukprot:978488-Pyramimonas_sp.AAC.1